MVDPRIFLVILLVLSCSPSNERNISKEIKRPIPESIAPDSILNSVIDTVAGHRFAITSTKNGVFIENNKGKLIYKDDTYSPFQEFIDFNGDGHKDILIEYMTNVPGIKDLLLYDKAEKTFKKVIDLQDYPSAVRIKQSKYYYSYHRSGCADSNWDSDLFYIEDYRTVKIGSISGRNCENSGIDDGIYIYSLKNGRKMQVQKLPISILRKHADKWEFIAKYWAQNLKRFEY